MPLNKRLTQKSITAGRLREGGRLYREIAETLGVTKQRAHQLVQSYQYHIKRGTR